jgi:glutathione S-transferase
MKLYGAPMPAPNPRRVRMFLAEKGIDLPETPINLTKREHKSSEHLVPRLRGFDGLRRA